jgi:pimeloyl-ACP methyl ester carboxylesterase
LLAAAAVFGDKEPDYDDIGSTGGAPASPANPQPAFGLGRMLRALDPRQLLKPFTVWQMKDQAGRVGAKGVSALLRGVLAVSQAHIHLLGHSYGCKVVMTALCTLPDGLRKVHSALLLQPAVSQYAFSAEVPGRPGIRGGFATALDRVTVPVVSTFSANDTALTKLFHLALRRQRDLGEEPEAAAGGPSSRYAALGGFGPQASRETVVDILDPGQPYQLSADGHIVGVDGTRTISSHGDISNPSTWWLAYSVATA